jgi:hypothetical protein
LADIISAALSVVPLHSLLGIGQICSINKANPETLLQQLETKTGKRKIEMLTLLALSAERNYITTFLQEACLEFYYYIQNVIYLYPIF